MTQVAACIRLSPARYPVALPWVPVSDSTSVPAPLLRDGAFLRRFRNIRIPEGERHSFHTGSVFGVDRLPLEWELCDPAAD